MTRQAIPPCSNGTKSQFLISLGAQVRSRSVANYSRREADAKAPITLHRVMKETIAKQLRARYEPPQDMPHALLVLVMQMNDENDEKAKGV